MRVDIQVLTGIALGLALLVGVSGVRRISRPQAIETPTQERRDPSSPHGVGATRNAAILPDMGTVHVVEDPVSKNKILQDQIELLERGTPLELMINNLAKPGSDESYAAELLRRHRLITESLDEPEWTKDTERKLWETIASSQEGPAFEVASIVCRAAGCEVQVFADSQKAASAWHDLTGRLARRIPVAVLRSNFSSGSGGGRGMRVLFLLRDAAANRVPEGALP